MASQEPQVVYSLKVIPKKKAEYSVIRLHGVTGQRTSVESLKEAVLEVCKENVSLDNFGFIEPGHGVKGKQRWLISNEDLKDMYAIHQGKKEILLWCYTADQGLKRCAQTTDEPEPKRSRYDRHLDKMTEIEEIEEKLREKHVDGPFSEEQLRSCAHLIQMKKHSSYDQPPAKPFWKTRSNKVNVSSPCAQVSVSPSKRVNLRGQCVQQLLQFHELLEKGGIRKEQ